MEIGLIGLPLSGKTTLFNLLTGAHQETARFFSGKTDVSVGVARVPDRRVDFLARLYKPKKVTYAQIQFTEVPGLVRGASQGAGVGNAFLQAIRLVDALVHVVRAFEDADVPHVDGSVDPLRDIETIALEILFADLGVLENRIKRMEEATKKRKEWEEELPFLKRCYAALEAGEPLGPIAQNDVQKQALRTYSFLSEKPLLICVNVDEAQFKAGNYPRQAEVEAYCAARNLTLVTVCGQLEMEISQLEGEDREVFMADLGLAETGIERLARAAYEHLGLISFLTYGEDEVRAWTIKRGTTAREAAGRIHSDLERGFVRAEVAAFADLQASGTMAKVREMGAFRLEGKDYIVRDGDLITIRFNI